MNEQIQPSETVEDDWFLAPEPAAPLRGIAPEQELDDPWFDRFKPLSSFPPPPPSEV